MENHKGCGLRNSRTQPNFRFCTHCSYEKDEKNCEEYRRDNGYEIANLQWLEK